MKWRRIPAAAIYGVAQGLARGSGLLSLLLMAHVLSATDLGLYALIVTGIQLGSQALSLGGGTAVVREGAGHTPTAQVLAQRFSGFAVSGAAIVAVCAFALLPIGNLLEVLIGGVFIASQEAVHQVLLLAVRCQDRPWKYLSLSTTKAIAWIATASYLAVRSETLELVDVLVYQFVSYVFVSGLLLLFCRVRGKPKELNMRQIVLYSLPMVVHGLAQWVINSADKVIIKWQYGSLTLGQYSIGYTVASLMLIATSGIALHLPNEVIINYRIWHGGRHRLEFLIKYSLVMLAGLFIILCGVEIDRRWIGLLHYYPSFLPAVVGLAGGGFYFVGVYYLYACFHIRQADTSTLARQTIQVAGISIVATAFFVWIAGPVGAALATFATYAVYMLMVYGSATRLEGGSAEWSDSRAREAAVIAVSALLMVLGGVGQSYLWGVPGHPTESRS